jgi:hypothetical protein
MDGSPDFGIFCLDMDAFKFLVATGNEAEAIVLENVEEDVPNSKAGKEQQK